MSRFGVNLLPNLPSPKIQNHSPLLKGLTWPKDKEYIAALHGSDWMFHLVAWIRRHILQNATELFTFTSRDHKQALPYLQDLTVLFNPISLLSLYFECLSYYRDCVVGELIDFQEGWYLSIVRAYYTLEDFEADDWFWRYALRQVIWVPRKGIPMLQKSLPDWISLPGSTNASGVPEDLLVKRFPEIVSRVSGIYQVITNDLKMAKPPTVSSDGPWGCLAEPNSPFHRAVGNIDQFFLSLYSKKDAGTQGMSFQFSMALDILQSLWSETDWKHNIFATKFYNTLITNNDVKSFNTTTVSKNAAATQAGNIINSGNKGNDQNGNNTDFAYEPQPFFDLRVKIQMLAADMAFDYCSDHELQLLVSDLDTLVRNSNFPRQGRSSYFTILKHLKSKIQLYNMIQTNTNENGNDNDGGEGSTTGSGTGSTGPSGGAGGYNLGPY